MKRGAIRRFITTTVVTVVIVCVGYLDWHAYQTHHAVPKPTAPQIETSVVETCWGIQIVHRELNGVPESDQLHCLSHGKRRAPAKAPTS